MAPFEAHYERKCKPAIWWFELEDIKPLVTNLVQEAQKKERLIQAKLLVAQSRQKEYADHKVRGMLFNAGEKALLKVYPTKGILKFEKRSKLSP